MRLSTILNQLQPITAYKFMNWSGETVTKIPGYCIVDLGPKTSHGLYYTEILELRQPLYSFKIRGLVPWVKDEIVGLGFNESDYSPGIPTKTTRERIDEIRKIKETHSQDEIYKIVNGDIPAPEGYNETSFVWAFEPGWLWTDKITTGCPGESIVTVPVKMKIVSGEHLDHVIEKCSEFINLSKDELYKQASEWPNL